MRPTILLDVDDVLADFEPPYFKIINEVTGLQLGPEDRTEWEMLSKIPAEFHVSIRERAREEGFCLNLDPKPGAQKAVEQLRFFGDVYAVTAPWDGHKTWCWERTEWLKQHFGFKPKEVLHVSAKYLVRGNVLIDDRADYLVEWARANHILSLAILWDARYNQQAPRDLIRAGNWEHVIRLLSLTYGTPSSLPAASP